MASITKRPNGRWQATIKGPDRRERTNIFDRKVEADRWVTTQRADMLRGAWVDPAAGKATLREFATTWLGQQQWRTSTRHAVENTVNTHLIPALGQRQLASLRRSDLQTFVASLALAPSTVSTVHQHVRTIFGAAVEDGRIVRNPAVGVKLPEVVKAPVVPMSAEQVWTLADAAPDHLRVIVVLGAGLGLRQGETLGLSVDRIDFLRRQVRIDRQMVTPPSGPPSFGPPKTKASFRIIPASTVVLDQLAAHIKAYGTGVDGILIHLEGVAPSVGTDLGTPGGRLRRLSG